MSTYKFIYFNLTGLGEPIRLILHQSGIKFEDNRITFEEWPQIKSQMPAGQLPVLEIDGKQYYQSKSIARFLAKRNNLAGSNDEEAFLADATVDTIDDFRLASTLYYWEQDPKAKEVLKQKAFEKLPQTLSKLEEQVKKNGGYLVNGKLTWADLWYAATAELVSNILKMEINKDYQELAKLVTKVKALPNIKAYLDKRPETMF